MKIFYPIWVSDRQNGGLLPPNASAKYHKIEPGVDVRILMVGLNYAPEPVGIGPYSAGMVEALSKAGHDVRVIAGKPYYPSWKTDWRYRRLGYHRSVERGVRIVRCPHYVPAKPNGARRIFHHISFALSSFFPAIAVVVRFRPDVVIAVAPSLIAAPTALLAARIAGARSWLHVQDFEVEAAFATGLMDQHGTAARAALGFQRLAIRSFDVVSSISPQMCAKLATLGVASHRIAEFRNWSDLSRIHVLRNASPYRTEWGIDQPFIALYSGNIANKQGIEIIVEAARQLHYRRDILFLICGEGSQRNLLAEKAADLSNVRFMPLQPVERLGDLVGLASVHLLPQLAGAADLVLPSKLTNMLASGRPVIATAEPGTGLADEVEGCGIVVPPGNADAFSHAIAMLADEPARAADYGNVARCRAEERWSREAILDKFITRLEALVRENSAIAPPTGSVASIGDQTT